LFIGRLVIRFTAKLRVRRVIQSFPLASWGHDQHSICVPGDGTFGERGGAAGEAKPKIDATKGEAVGELASIGID